MTDLWVFGYGSLMWRPGFSFLESSPALLHGHHRALCVYSWVHRGTEAQPGLVLGLDRGGSCRGAAFRVAETDAESVTQYLRERELVTSVYLEAHLPIHLPDGKTVDALVFLVDRNHHQYAGNRPREVALTMVGSSRGHSGPNREYVLNTADHLARLGIADPMLDWLATRLREQEPE